MSGQSAGGNRQADELFGVSIQGPDDLIAVTSYEAAVRVAHAFNTWWLGKIRTRGQDENDPRMWAVPISWPGTAESHFADLHHPSPDYALFMHEGTR